MPDCRRRNALLIWLITKENRANFKQCDIGLAAILIARRR
jgi:hypothetical protein